MTLRSARVYIAMVKMIEIITIKVCTASSNGVVQYGVM